MGCEHYLLRVGASCINCKKSTANILKELLRAECGLAWKCRTPGICRHNEIANPIAGFSLRTLLMINRIIREGVMFREVLLGTSPRLGTAATLGKVQSLTGLYSLCPLWNQSLKPLVEVHKTLLSWGHRGRPITVEEENRKKPSVPEKEQDLILLETIQKLLQVGEGSASLRRPDYWG